MRFKHDQCILFVLCLLLSLSKMAYPQVEEYTLKAVFIEKIPRFLTWPGEKKNDWIGDSFIISILGENPFGTLLDEIYADRRIKKKRVKIRYITEIKAIEGTHLLYLSPSVKDELPEILAFIKGKPILTITDSDGFLEQGILVNLSVEAGKLMIEINQKGFQDAGFKIDSLLLKVVKIMNPV